MNDIILKAAGLNKILNQILVKDVMSKPVVTIKQHEDFSMVEETFVDKNIRHLAVVDDKYRLVGVISQKDVYTHIAPRRMPEGQIIYREGIIIDEDGYYEKESLNKYLLNYIMNRKPITITADETLGDAITLLISKKIGCLPVIREDRYVVGMITRGDFLRLAKMVYQKEK